MAPGRPDFRWAAKTLAAIAFCLVGALAGTGLYFGNLAYVKAGDDAARTAAAQATATPRKLASAEAAATHAAAELLLPYPKPANELQAAADLAPLLAASTSDRTAVFDAYDDAYACGGNFAVDQRIFQQAAANRQYFLSKLHSLPDRALPARMLSALASAWVASISADNYFAAWVGDEIGSGCVSGDTADPNLSATVTPDNEATADKQAFASLWNPIAGQYALPQYNAGQL